MPLTAPSPDLVLMLLADGRLPTSGHTQSGGLEAALAHGLQPQQIPDYCRSRLATVALVEAGIAVVVRARALAGDSLEPAEDAWAARTPSMALRQASYSLGRGYRRLAGELWPQAAALLPARRDLSRGMVLGAVAAVTGLPADSLARLVAYDDLQTVVSAGLKLTPFDPILASRWVHDRAGDVEALVASVAALTDPTDVPACSAPLLEGWAEDHTHAPRRLFHA